MVENIVLTVVQGASTVFLMLVVVVLKVFVGLINEYCSTVNGSCTCNYSGTTHTIKGIVVLHFKFYPILFSVGLIKMIVTKLFCFSETNLSYILLFFCSNRLFKIDTIQL